MQASHAHSTKADPLPTLICPKSRYDPISEGSPALINLCHIYIYHPDPLCFIHLAITYHCLLPAPVDTLTLFSTFLAATFKPQSIT